MSYKSYKAEVLQALKDAVSKGLDEIGDRCVGHAQDLAPVDTGNMRASIIHEREGEYTEAIGPSNSAAPYKDVYYAKYVELGTHRQNPQPFLRPAAENYRSEYETIMEQALKGS